MQMRAMGILIGFGVLASGAAAADPTYWQDVRPLLRKHCTVCHKESKLQEPEISAGLALDSLPAIRKGGPVPVLKAGKPDESLLITLLTEKKLNRRMPLDSDPLAANEIALLRKWVELGAPEGIQPAETSIEPGPATPRVQPRLPVVFSTKAILPKSWNIAGTLDVVLPVGPLSPVAALAFDPLGLRLAVGSYGRVTVWSLSSGQPEKVLTNILGSVNDLKFSPDGKRLAVAGGQPTARGDLRLFDTQSWKLLASLGGHLDVVSGVSFSPDGSKLVSASFDKTVRLWDLASNKVLHTFTGHSDFVYGVAYSPKGDWYATASKDRTSRIVDATTGKSKLTLSGMEQDVLAVAIRPDSAQVVTSGQEPQLFWWDSTSGERVRRQGGHDTGVNEVAFAAKGDVAASAGLDKTARLWNPQTGAVQRSIPVGSAVFAVALDPTGKRLATGSADGMVRLFESATGRHLLTLWSGGAAEPKAISELPAWLALTPEGFLAGDPISVKNSGFQTSGKPLPAGKLNPITLQNLDWIGKAARGEKLPEPTFEGK